jgi:hypothetical protein
MRNFKINHCFGFEKNDFFAELFMEDSDETKPKGYDVRKHHTLQAPNKTQMNRKKTVGSQVRLFTKA